MGSDKRKPKWCRLRAEWNVYKTIRHDGLTGGHVRMCLHRLGVDDPTKSMDGADGHRQVPRRMQIQALWSTHYVVDLFACVGHTCQQHCPQITQLTNADAPRLLGCLRSVVWLRECRSISHSKCTVSSLCFHVAANDLTRNLT